MDRLNTTVAGAVRRALTDSQAIPNDSNHSTTAADNPAIGQSLVDHRDSDSTGDRLAREQTTAELLVRVSSAWESLEAAIEPAGDTPVWDAGASGTASSFSALPTTAFELQARSAAPDPQQPDTSIASSGSNDSDGPTTPPFSGEPTVDPEWLSQRNELLNQYRDDYQQQLELAQGNRESPGWSSHEAIRSDNAPERRIIGVRAPDGEVSPVEFLGHHRTDGPIYNYGSARFDRHGNLRSGYAWVYEPDLVYSFSEQSFQDWFVSQESTALTALAAHYGMTDSESLLNQHPDFVDIAIRPDRAENVGPALDGVAMAPADDLLMIDITLSDPDVQALISVDTDPLPEITDPAARAQLYLYGEQRFEAMQRYDRAMSTVRSDYSRAVSAAGAERELSAPWWTVHEVGGKNGYTTTTFSVDRFTEHYVQQDSPSARLFNAYYGASNTREIGGGKVGDNTTHLTSFAASGWHSRVSSASVSANLRHQELATIDLSDLPSLYDDQAIFLIPGIGWVTPHENVVVEEGWNDYLEDAVLIAAVVGVSVVSGGWATGFATGLLGAGAAGTIAGAALAGGLSSAVSGVIYGNFDWDDVLKGAFAGIVTAGLDRLTHSLSLPNNALVNAGSNAIEQGIASELLGGDFETGLINGLVSQVTSDIVADLDIAIGNSNLTSAQATVARQSARLVASAIRIAHTDGHFGQQLAQEFVANLTESIVEPAANAAHEAGVNAGTNVSDWIDSLAIDNSATPSDTSVALPDDRVTIVDGTLVMVADDGSTLVVSATPDGSLVVKDEHGNTVLLLDSSAQAQSGFIQVSETAAEFGDFWFLDELQIRVPLGTLLNALARLGARAMPLLLLGIPTNTTHIVHISHDGQHRYFEALGEFGRFEQLIDGQWVTIDDRVVTFDGLSDSDRALFNEPLSGPAPTPEESEQTPPFPDQSDEIDGTSDGFPADGAADLPNTMPGAEITDPDPGDNIYELSALGGNLEADGWLRPGTDYDAHHLIPQGDSRADMLRQRLLDAGININDSRNGVWLPRNEGRPNPDGRTPHNQTLRESYFRYLEDKFRNVSQQDFPALLDEVRQELLNGEYFPTVDEQ